MFRVAQLVCGFAICAAAITQTGCFVIDQLERIDAAAQSRIDNFKQQLELAIDGQTVTVPLDSLDVYVPDAEGTQETFEILGENVNLVGRFQAGVTVGFDEEWKKLLGKPIEISATLSSEEVEVDRSYITLPGQAEAAVLGGRFTIEEVQDSYGAQTPLIGTIELRIQTPAGEKELRGKVRVVGTTWG